MLASLSAWIGQLFGVAQPDLTLTALMTALLAIAFSGYVSMLLIILRWIAANTYGEVMPETGLAKWLKQEVRPWPDFVQIATILVTCYVAFVCLDAVHPDGAMKYVLPGLVCFGYTDALRGMSKKTSK